MLLFELGRECNLGKCHAKCPNMHPDRLSGLDCRKELDDETIIQAAIAAHKAHGFAGLVGWHYYNEPTLQGERMLHLMDAISESVPDARYILWTNNTNPEWIAENRNRFAWISYSNYAGDPLGLQLDNRLERMPTRYPEPCLRPFTEMICDCYGNHHACCQDWRGESSLGNIMVEGFSTIVGKWEQLQTSVCGKAMTDDAPEGCKQCGHRPDAGCFDRPSLIRALRWRDGK
jgi:hypothetical protein